MFHTELSNSYTWRTLIKLWFFPYIVTISKLLYIYLLAGHLSVDRQHSLYGENPYQSACPNPLWCTMDKKMSSVYFCGAYFFSLKSKDIPWPVYSTAITVYKHDILHNDSKAVDLCLPLLKKGVKYQIYNEKYLRSQMFLFQIKKTTYINCFLVCFCSVCAM
jgi:hypothetical protein